MPDNTIVRRFFRDGPLVLSALALLAFLVHIIVNATTAYGFFRDELYYVACTEHLAFGYVDQPPLSILLLALSRLIFGDSLVGLRVLPALVAALTVFFTGSLARLLGGGRYAQTLAALCALIAPQYLGMMNYFSMNSFDVLFWLIAMILVVRIIKEENPRLWLLFGVVAGLGAQNKFSVFFLCFGIAVGLLLTSERKHLLNRWFWLGAGIAAIIFLPHIIWQIANNFPTVEFVRNATANKNVISTPLEFLLAQILFMSPFTFPIWALGIVYFFFWKQGKQFRLFGWSYVAIFALFVLQRGKPYYLSPIYPIFLAGGAIAIETFIQKRWWQWLRATIVAVLAVNGVLGAPFALPVLPPETFIAYSNALGIQPSPEERHEMGKLPQHFADMFGWEEQVAAVARAFHKLSPAEQAKCALVGDNYGRAGAIDFFGTKYGLPKAISRHNNYWLWGTRGYTGEVVIVIGGGLEDKQAVFESVEVTETVSCEYCMPYENNLRVYICRGLKVPLDELWATHKSFD